MKYKLVIFDFDGTLADSFPWFLRYNNSVADKYGFRRIDESEVESFRGYSARQIIKQLGVPLWKIPLIANHMRQVMRRDIFDVPLFPGVDELLRELSERGVVLAIVSSNSCENIRRVLGPENAARIAYYECDVSLFGKRGRFQRVLKKSGLKPGEAICIGDELRDMEAARGAKMAFGAVSWGYTQVEALRAESPDEVFESVQDIGRKIG